MCKNCKYYKKTYSYILAIKLSVSILFNIKKLGYNKKTRIKSTANGLFSYF